MTIEIYTDGGCFPNPGPGSWAFLIRIKDGAELYRESGFEREATNNRMEITAALRALTWVKAIPSHLKPSDVIIFTDSQYLLKGATIWMRGWIKNGWKKKSKIYTRMLEPVKNRDLWEALNQVNYYPARSWQWVRGHNGNEFNEAVDAMCVEAMKLGKGK